MAMTGISPAKAEELLRTLVKSGESMSEDLQDNVEKLVEQSKRGAEQLFETIQTEVHRQLKYFGLVDQSTKPPAPGAAPESYVAPIAATVGAAVKQPAAKKAPAKATAAGKAPAKRPAKPTAAKKAAKKAPVKKAAPKKAAAKDAPAKKLTAVSTKKTSAKKTSVR